MNNKLKSSLINGSLYSGKAHLLFWTVFTVGFIADRLSKAWVIDYLGLPGSGREVVIVEDYFRFATVLNPGAVWGAFANQTWFLLGVSSLAICFVFWIFSTSNKRAWYSHLACGLILAGALGNFYDRMFNDGYVIDFIEVDLHFKPANPWPTFNIADSLLFVGVPILIIPMLLADLKAGKKEKTVAAPDEPVS